MKGANELRILIADDHEIVRRGLKSVLSERPGWTVCAEAVSGRDAVAKAKEHRPDIALIDITMPEMNGLEATRKICKMVPETEVLILSVHYTDQLVREIVEAGAHGYILKTDTGRDLLIAIEALAKHQPFFTSSASQILLDGFCNRDGAEASVLTHKTLTAREREVVQLLAEGKSSKEVAATLDISTKTAETHRSNIMRKLDMHSVSEIVRYAVKNKMIEP